MTPKPHPLLLALTALAFAGAAAAQTASGYSELFDQASNAYEKAD